MPTYTAPTKDMAFLMHDVLKAHESDIPPGYGGDLEPSFTSAVLEEAGKLASEVLTPPLNTVGDHEVVGWKMAWSTRPLASKRRSSR